MTWYTGHYGSWTQPSGVTRIGGTYDRKEMFAEAQAVANKLGVGVTIISETGGSSGLKIKTYTVNPETTKED